MTLGSLRERIKQAYPELPVGEIRTIDQSDLFEIKLEDDILYVGFDDLIHAFRIDFENEPYGNEMPDAESTFHRVTEILSHWF
jgi:hypothetical protein